jgi:hypothetical protein
MKKLLPILLISVMIFAMAVTPVSANRGLKLEVEYGTPEIDGKIDDIYGESAAIVDLPHNGDKKGSADTATVKALWDENGFYFLVIAKDSSLEEKECFEFFLTKSSTRAKPSTSTTVSPESMSRPAKSSIPRRMMTATTPAARICM